jgi:hypothetical protein
MYSGSVVLGLVAVGWALERVFGLESSVSGLVDPILDWPRSLFIAMGLTVIAAGLHAYERSSGRLLALPEATPHPHPAPVAAD